MIVLMREGEVAGVERKGTTEVERRKPPVGRQEGRARPFKSSTLLGRDVKPKVSLVSRSFRAHRIDQRVFSATKRVIVEIRSGERGSQRERDRERAQARSGGKSKQPKNDGLTPEQRRQRDAKALQEKAAKKAAQAGGVSGGKN
ncbi:unnamed protein product [Prunus armeniaca]|uniref:Small EDRK-rich factor-like N-terminal domain-containing protein n=1 Tax=Prunus armeniaca TaxID=36596 RepID=A0A6J5Y626_PRUAR|nr:unnamed protein product [Prunus armeniaca]